ncbi:MAG: hypothetical protein HRU03_08125, partial [Nanoarchaeales archaeon]|nr:hypothetical protein [Nanoarchaeales archaeon]
QVFSFNYTSGIDNSEIYKLYLNFTLNLGGNESDFDNDGILDLLDTIIGNSDNIETSFSSLVMSVNSSTNLSVIYSDVLNVSFSDNSEKIFEFEHNFSESSIYLTSLTVKSETINNKSKLFLNGLILSGNKTKTVYLKLSGNYSKFYSLCLKDSKVISFDEISELCDGLNETFINSIPSSLNGYDISFTNSSNSTIKVSGLKHSGLSQMCTEKWIYSSSFSVCVSNSQFKIPFDENLCGTEHTKPSILTQSCGFIQTDDDNSGGGRSSYNYYENNVELNIENESSIETDNISNELNLSYNESSNFSNINNNNSEFLHTNDTLSFNGNIVNSDMNNKNKLVQSDNKQYQVYILAFLFFISFIIILKIILLKHKVVLIKEEKHKLKK